MQVVETEITDIKLLKPVRHADSRGSFSEVFREDVLREQEIDIHFGLPRFFRYEPTGGQAGVGG
jgi:dTDP-4-dehydrorhamnose 3,5-epimerase-like enzyme